MPKDDGEVYAKKHIFWPLGKKIFRWFFKPLFKYKPPTVTASEWMEYLFNSRHRTIATYKATKDFIILGGKVITTKLQLYGTPKRIKKGTYLVMRHDNRVGDVYEIEVVEDEGLEVPSKVKVKSTVYKMNKIEWEHNERFMKLNA